MYVLDWHTPSYNEQRPWSHSIHQDKIYILQVQDGMFITYKGINVRL